MPLCAAGFVRYFVPLRLCSNFHSAVTTFTIKFNFFSLPRHLIARISLSRFNLSFLPYFVPSFSFHFLFVILLRCLLIFPTRSYFSPLCFHLSFSCFHSAFTFYFICHPMLVNYMKFTFNCLKNVSLN